VRVEPTDLPGVLVIEPRVFRDARGFFVETYHAEKYARHGMTGPFAQDNHSSSLHNTVRGLHLQVGRPQAKLVHVVEGEIYDVAVDVRRGSPTFGRWVGILLSAESFRQCYIPAGFAHGFAVTSGAAQVVYKCSDTYDPATEVGIAWNDPTLAVPWPVGPTPILSDRDRQNPTLSEAMDLLPDYSRTKL
jgi:dTDP-4-dehydrorhamnose 3,5-epimerase